MLIFTCMHMYTIIDKFVIISKAHTHKAVARVSRKKGVARLGSPRCSISGQGFGLQWPP